MQHQQPNLFWYGAGAILRKKIRSRPRYDFDEQKVGKSIFFGALGNA